MDELEDRLRGIKLAEPPLGFDPDEVAGKAAKKVRNGRAVALTGVATLAVIAAAVVFVAPKERAAEVAPAAPPSRAEQKAGDLRHLKDVLPGILVGAREINVHDFVQVNDRDLMTSEVEYTDAAGMKRQVNLTISGPVSTKTDYPREGRCDLGRRGDAIGPDRKPMRCIELVTPAGIPVVISETTPKNPDQVGQPIVTGQGFSTGKVLGRHAIAWQPDGGSVNVGDLGEVGDFGAPDSGPSLTDEQLIKLVTDPAFTFR
ncbi:hypothetical protein [Amycolatopsis sp. BJA-103]|uniref:hypothetical protein n=1 Tax=unclassified Amycolatopsis TaxID=2618356 RepID=UPI000C77102D|nr:hypothetical protein [Amycolatopsis sp. BJA-103]AUI60937.1 hypothetical protein BKN51_23950 [Amycolatopsis sp. BJA-103]PNE21777.1 hypothetical protein B1H26_08530 [Amycolatopsis sp. BJA-103]